MKTKMRNIFLNLILIIASLCLVYGRIHELNLEDDNREQISISTYGFLKNGLLQIHVKNLEFNPLFKLESMRNSFAFILEKTKNNGFSSFSANKKKQDYCSIIRKKNPKNINKDLLSESLNKNGEHSYSLIIFRLDLIKKNVDLIRIGTDLNNLRINSKLIGKYGYSLKKNESAKRLSTKNSESSLSNNVTEAGKSESFDPNLLSDKFDNSALINEFIEDRGLLKTINLNMTNSSLSFNFEMNVKSSMEEGLYMFSFFNCFEPTKNDLKINNNKQAKNKINERNYYFEYDQLYMKFGVNLDIAILERNEDSFLSAGEIPDPILYLTWSIIYFLAGISWMYIVKSSKGEVFKIHYLMLALVFVKSSSLTFHAINLHYIAVNGTQEAVWAILYYITYVLRGLLLIISILLVGTGFSIIKHILTENERRLFAVIIPLQTLSIIAYIFLEEKELGNANYVTWRQIFFLLDLFCCGAILFPVIWSIRHLEAAARTDGKMVFNLRKLKIFKHFYLMLIIYVYCTRIIGFLLKQMLPFRYEWFDELSMEIFTFTFFALTGYKFQPTLNNPYLQVGDDDLDMAEINNQLIGNDRDVDDQTVLDLIEQDYYINGLVDEDNTQLQPSGPDSKNPTLFSRKQNVTSDE